MGPAIAALWLGLLTAMGPCTMTTNLLAVAYVARRIDKPLAVVLSGLWFTLGTVVGYAGLASLVVAGAFSMPAASHFLQKYMNQLLGPALILTGVVLLGLWQVRPAGDVPRVAEKLARRGDALGAVALGAVFALTFCPVSAALFFGSLIPLALKTRSVFALPALYGLGTGIPVLCCAALLAAGSGTVGKLSKRVAEVEPWARKITGGAFVAAGVHFCLSYVFGLY
jgi:hypothetical protein